MDRDLSRLGAVLSARRVRMQSAPSSATRRPTFGLRPKKILVPTSAQEAKKFWPPGLHALASPRIDS